MQAFVAPGLTAISGTRVGPSAQRLSTVDDVHVQPADSARRRRRARRSGGSGSEQIGVVFAVQTPPDSRPATPAVPPVKRLTVKREEIANPFLNGNHYPQHNEMVVADLQIDGELPRDIDGTYVRNGPNPQFVPKDMKYHVFDGDGMVHAVEMRDGRASYVNRFVRTEGFERERAAGRALWVSTLSDDFAAMMLGMLRNRVVCGSVAKNTANTSVLAHGGRLLALWEGGLPHELSLPDLETRGIHDFAGAYPGPFTAHPKVCPKTGELVFFGYQVESKPEILYGVADAAGRVTHTTGVSLPVPVMMHDFAVTERYSLFLDFALEFRMERARRLKSPLHFDRERPARIGLLPRHAPGSEIRWFTFGPGFAFHVMNAHEEEGPEGTREVVLYAARFDDLDLASGEGRVDEARNLNCPRLWRWRMNLDTGATSEGPVTDPKYIVDFPVVPPSLVGQPFRYGYMPRFAPGRFVMNQILKVDVHTGEVVEHALPEGWFCQEAVFVPRAGAAAEDDGYLLAMAGDEGSASSEESALLVIDARDMALRARLRMPHRVPYGFHGTFVPSGAL
eukprot:tig00001071_g6805.t1